MIEPVVALRRVMNRMRFAFTIGVVIAISGLVPWLSSHTLATTWESIGPNAWGGTTDPATEHKYQIIGLTLFVFGLSCWHWRSVAGCSLNTTRRRPSGGTP